MGPASVSDEGRLEIDDIELETLPEGISDEMELEADDVNVDDVNVDVETADAADSWAVDVLAASDVGCELGDDALERVRGGGLTSIIEYPAVIVSMLGDGVAVTTIISVTCAADIVCIDTI